MTEFDLSKLSEMMSVDKIAKDVKDASPGKKEYAKDTRLWKPTTDESGNSYAVIRFLPPCDGETKPFVKVLQHFFRGPGGYYVENSLTTLGNPDPVAEYQSNSWPSNSDPNADDLKAAYRSRKARKKFYMNIYVIEDKNNPDAVGKVWLYEAGPLIFKMIDEAMNPKFDDDPAIPVFDPVQGANFKFKAYTEGNYLKYDKSGFDSPSPFLDGDAEAVFKVWQQCYPLQPFVAEDQFKSYDELKAKFYRVMGLNAKGEEIKSGVDPDVQRAINDADQQTEDTPVTGVAKSQPADTTASPTEADVDDDEEDPLAVFRKMKSGT